MPDTAFDQLAPGRGVEGFHHLDVHGQLGSPPRVDARTDTRSDRNGPLSPLMNRERSTYARRYSLFSLRPKSTLVALPHGASSPSRYSGGAARDGIHFRRPSLAAESSTYPSTADPSRTRLLFSRVRKSKDIGDPRQALTILDAEVLSSSWKDKKNSRRGHKRGSSLGAVDLNYRIPAPLRTQQSTDLAPDARKRHHHSTGAVPEDVRQSVVQSTIRSPPQPLPPRPKRSDELLRRPTERPLPAPNFSQPSPHLRILPDPLQSYRPPLPPLSPLRNLSQPPMRSPARLLQPTTTDVEDLESTLLQELTPPFQPQPEGNFAAGGKQDEEHTSSPARSAMAYRRQVARQRSSSADGPTSSASLTQTIPLEKVAEESEGSLPQCDSPVSRKRLSIRRSVSSPCLPDRTHLISKAPVELPKGSSTSPRPVSQCSETLGELSFQSAMVERGDGYINRKEESFLLTSPPGDTLDCSWEEDIDFSYKCAAECNFDFDWSSLTRLESSTTEYGADARPWERRRHQSKHHINRSVDSTDSGGGGIFKIQPGPFDHLYNTPATDSLPDLDTRSAHSNSTYSGGAMTPVSKLSLHSATAVDFIAEPPDLPIIDRSDNDESGLDEVLGEYHNFLIEAKSLPVGVRPKSRLREEGGKLKAMGLAPMPLLLEKALPDAPTSEEATRSPPSHSAGGRTLESIVARLRSPRGSPNRALFTPELFGRQELPDTRARNDSLQRRTAEERTYDSPPPIPERSPQHIKPMTTIKPSGTSPKGHITAKKSPSASGLLDLSCRQLPTPPTTTYTPTRETILERRASQSKGDGIATKGQDIQPLTPRTPLLDIFQIEQLEELLPSSSPSALDAKYLSTPAMGSSVPPIPQRQPPPCPLPPPPPLKDPQHRRRPTREKSPLTAASVAASVRPSMGSSSSASTVSTIPKDATATLEYLKPDIYRPPNETKRAALKASRRSYSLFPTSTNTSSRGRFATA